MSFTDLCIIFFIVMVALDAYDTHDKRKIMMKIIEAENHKKDK